MIKKVTDNISLSGVSSPLLPLIYCDFIFNSGDTEGVYFQYNENDGITSVFSLKNGCITLARVKDADLSELSMFFDFLGVSEIISDYPLDDSFEKIPLLETTARYENASDVSFLLETSKLSEYLGVYNLLNDSEGEFSGWYSNFSKKINSGVACGVYKVYDDSIVSTVTATAIYDKTAIISGVFTNPLYRGKGYASRCVKAVINQLCKKNVEKVYLWCEEDKIPFYKKLGFKFSGQIYLRKV
ncbi:MAG: GNAT family N-acetyltransferase [Ruminococcaceae bacterium]|nr:GNAT family N-acetyltransferase [Oscillospiraceae bacterium]